MKQSGPRLRYLGVYFRVALRPEFFMSSWGYQDAQVTDSVVRPRRATDLRLRKRWEEVQRREEHLKRSRFTRSGAFEIWHRTRKPMQRITDVLLCLCLALLVATAVVFLA